MTTTALRSLDWRHVDLHKLGLAFVMAAAIILSFGGARAHAEEIKVTIDNFTFAPNELKVKVGDTVTWINHDDIPHTVSRPENSAPRPWIPTEPSRSPSPPRATTSIFARCIRT